MKRFLIALAVALLSGAAVAQTAAPPEKILTIALPVSQWGVVLAGLGKLPLETAEQTYQAIQNQAAPQVNPPAADKDKTDKKESKK